MINILNQNNYFTQIIYIQKLSPMNNKNDTQLMEG